MMHALEMTGIATQVALSLGLGYIPRNIRHGIYVYRLTSWVDSKAGVAVN